MNFAHPAGTTGVASMHVAASLAALISLVGLCPSVVAQQDPVGAFKGTIKPDKAMPMIPPQGIPLRLELTRDDGGSLAGRAHVASSISELNELRREGDGWTAKCKIMGMATQVSFALDDQALVGRMRGGGFSVEFRAEPTEVVAAPAPRPRTPVALHELTIEQWLEDLAFLEQQLPALHANWFDGLDQEQWQKAVAAARLEIPDLNAPQVVMRLAQLVALRGDAHTTLGYRTTAEFARCPVEFRQFADGVFVTKVAAAHEEVLGGRVVGVGTTAMDEVLAQLATVRASENEQWKRGNVAILCRPAALYGLGLIPSPNELPLVVESDGEEHRITLRSDKAAMVGPFDRDTPPAPTWLTRGHQPYWFETLDDGDTLYFAYNKCRSDPQRAFPQFGVELVEEIERRQPARVVVDLRRNGGGASMILEPIIDWLGVHPVLNQPSRLFVAIGQDTFSSAMINAAHLDQETRATLIGEPTGGKPNAYGEVRGTYLPRSAISLWYSTNHFRAEPIERPSVEPDRRVDLLSSDYFAGRDPVLAAIRGTEPAGPGWNTIAGDATIDGVWEGAFARTDKLPSDSKGTMIGGSLSFTLAVRTNEGQVDAALELLRPRRLLGATYDPDERVLSGRVQQPGDSGLVPVSFRFEGQTVRVKIEDAAIGVQGHGLRRRGADPEEAIARVEFEALAAAPAEQAAALARGERFIDLLQDDAPQLNTLAWRLLTEEAYGGRFDGLALRASRRSNELTGHDDWQHLDTLALAEFRAGDAKRAVDLERQALARIGDDPRRGELEAALQRFLAGRDDR
ncbi:MAG: hypothetical protein AAF628_18465 [Planctomycetota bacterium]